jgi:hypothetical protein
VSPKFALEVLGIWVIFAVSLSGCSLIPSQQQTTPTSPASSPASPSVAATGTATSSPSPTAKPFNSAATPAPSQPSASRPPLTVEKLKNSEYYFLTKGPIKLVNGTYEDKETKRTFTLSDVVTYGDVNKDGIKDAVTAIQVSIPNSGNFSYLVVLVNEDGNPKNIAAEFLGPSVKVKQLTIKPDKMIEAVMDQYQAGDAECCPSSKITRSYKVGNDKPSPTPESSPKK